MRWPYLHYSNNISYKLYDAADTVIDERRYLPDLKAVRLGGRGSFEGLAESQILRRDQQVFTPFSVSCQNLYVPTAGQLLLLPYYRRADDDAVCDDQKPTQHPYNRSTYEPIILRAAWLGGGEIDTGPVRPQILRRGRQVFAIKFDVLRFYPFTPAVAHNQKLISSEIGKVVKQRKESDTHPLAGSGKVGDFRPCCASNFAGLSDGRAAMRATVGSSDTSD